MAHEICTYPSLVLRRECRAVKDMTEAEFKLLAGMLQIMKRSNGIGLAAPQVGISRRLIVADIGDGPVMLANPVIEQKSDAWDVLTEGCLSLPGLSVEVKRPLEAVVAGVNEQGRPVRLEARGLLARVFQHEIDHLNGRLILDEFGWWERTKYTLGRLRP